MTAFSYLNPAPKRAPKFDPGDRVNYPNGSILWPEPEASRGRVTKRCWDHGNHLWVYSVLLDTGRSTMAVDASLEEMSAVEQLADLV